jgi:hypothetical protein
MAALILIIAIVVLVDAVAFLRGADTRDGKDWRFNCRLGSCGGPLGSRAVD